MYLDNISNEFKAQGHRSKVKVTRLKNVTFRPFDGVTYVELAVAMCEMSVLEGLWGKNTDKEGVAGGRVFIFKYVDLSSITIKISLLLPGAISSYQLT